MITELYLLGGVLVLAIIQILLTAMLRNSETGISYNTGPRDDEGPPVGKITGRMQRAQRNLYETLPLFAAAILIVAYSERESALSLFGAWLYFLARVAYVPLYAAGIPFVRSLAWVASLIGLLAVIAAGMFKL